MWLRYTALKRIGEAAHATIWLTYFDRSALAPRALRVTASEPLRDPGEAWSCSSLGEIGPSGAWGALEGPDTAGTLAQARWELSWQSRAPELAYLPARWLYDRAPLRSNGAALAPAATAAGVLKLDSDEVALDGWETMIGHNWGSEHAEEWCWIHSGGLGNDRGGWLDLLLTRIRFGPVLTPWIGAGAVWLDAGHYSPAPLRRVTCHRSGEHTTVHLPLSSRADLQLAITAPSHATVRWDYASPRGPGRLVDNCSVADAKLCLKSATGSHSLALPGTVAIEHGGPALTSV
jgi:hypothetical protein